MSHIPGGGVHPKLFSPFLGGLENDDGRVRVGVIGEIGTLFLKWGAPQGSLNASLEGGSCSKTNALMTRGCVLEQVVPQLFANGVRLDSTQGPFTLSQTHFRHLFK